MLKKGDGMRLQNKVAIITGAARGVGLAVAKRFCAEGARVVMTDINEAALLASASELEAKAFVHDVASEESWSELLAFVEKEFGQLDVLFNNAAILKAADIFGETLEGWRKIQSVNADSVFIGIKTCLPLMEQGGGAIINMSSSSALMGMPEFCAYTAAKSAVRSLTMSTAVFCKQRANRVRCNSIHPDGINTDMVREISHQFTEQQRSEYKRSIPFVCQPDDIANLALFLASDESRHINGAALSIDNTSTIHPPY